VAARATADSAGEGHACWCRAAATRAQGAAVARRGSARNFHTRTRTRGALVCTAVTSGQWHTLEATARGQTLTVRWDGITVRPVFDTEEAAA
jgi:hypothetical protein